MGTMNAFYVQGTADDLIAAIQKSFPAAKVSIGDAYIGTVLTPEDYEPPQATLSKLSADFSTDVIWLGFQSSVDAFHFRHWFNGACVRSLVYGCRQEERTWEEVEGQAEAWEAGAFFSAASREHLVKQAPGDEAKRLEYERIWNNRELVPGRMEPMVSSKQVAWIVARHYHFPGWETPGRPVPPLAPDPACPPPLPAFTRPFQVRARLIPKYLWTTASIDVYLDGRCILATGGQMKLTGAHAGVFKDGGKDHLAELKWGKGRKLRFPYQLWIDGTKVLDSWVAVENRLLAYIPAGIAFVIMFAISYHFFFHLVSSLGK